MPSDPTTTAAGEVLTDVPDDAPPYSDSYEWQPTTAADGATTPAVAEHDAMYRQPATAAQRYPWRVRCSGCGWVDHFDTQENAQAWADRHNAQPTWPHDAKVGPRD